MTACLEGIRVIEFSKGVQAASIAGRLLSELGAEVVKVELGDPDPLRERPPMIPKSGEGYTFAILNAGKKSVLYPAFDDKLRSLCENCDALLVDVEYAREKGIFNPLTADPGKRVVCCLSPFGLTGPKAGYAADDFIVQAASGIMATTGYVGGEPMQVGIKFTENAGALFAVNGILGGIFFRERNHCGQIIDISLQDAAVSYLSTFAPHVWLMGRKPTRSGGQHPIAVPWNIYKTLDGNVTICALADKMWSGLVSVMGMEDSLGGEEYATQAQRSKNRAFLDAAVARWAAERTVQEIVDKLEAADVPVAVIQTVPSLLNDTQFRFRGMVQTRNDPVSGRDVLCPGSFYTMSETPGAAGALASAAGAHNGEFGLTGGRQEV